MLAVSEERTRRDTHRTSNDAAGTSFQPTQRADGALADFLVSCPRNTRYFVAIKMGRRQGGPSRTGGKGSISKPIRDRRATRPPAHFHCNPLGPGASWLFFRVARSTRMTRIWVLRSRLEKQPTDLRQNTSYFGDRTLGCSLLCRS
jgi:hypothetical protein